MKFSTKKMVLTAMMIAVVYAITMATTIKITPNIYFNLGDVTIIITAVFLGGIPGFIAGSMGSALADVVLSSYYAPFTFVVKGLEGLAVALIISRSKSRSALWTGIASLAGVSVMVLGYYLTDLFFIPLIDKNFALTSITTNLGTNLIQATASIIIGIALVQLLIKSRAMGVLD